MECRICGSPSRSSPSRRHRRAGRRPWCVTGGGGSACRPGDAPPTTRRQVRRLHGVVDYLVHAEPNRSTGRHRRSARRRGRRDHPARRAQAAHRRRATAGTAGHRPPARPPSSRARDPQPSAPEIEAIAPPDGRLERLRGRLSKSQNAFGRSMLGLLGGGDLDEDSWRRSRTPLVADLGPSSPSRW